MFNVGLGELLVIVLVCLLVVGPQRLPDLARQVGRLLGQLRLAAQDALDQVKQDADLHDIDLPDLRVASLRTQARDYLGRLLDIDGQMAELQRTKAAITAKLAKIDQPESEGPTAAPAAQDADPPPGRSRDDLTRLLLVALLEPLERRSEQVPNRRRRRRGPKVRQKARPRGWVNRAKCTARRGRTTTPRGRRSVVRDGELRSV